MEFVLAEILIIGVFLDAPKTRFSPLVLLMILCLLLFQLYSKRHQKIPLAANSQTMLLLLFFLYLILNGYINCCAIEGFRRLIRFGVAISLFIIFSSFSINKPLIRRSFLIYSLMNFCFLGLSIIGLAYPSVWIRFWEIILQPQSFLFQLFEISRNRITPASPIYITFILPLIYFSSKRELNRFFGIFSFLSGVLVILFWNYRGYFATMILGVLMYGWLTKNIRIVLIYSLTISLLIYLGLSYLTNKPNVFKRFLLIDSIDKTTISERIDLLSRSWQFIKAYPIWGIGLGKFESSSTITKVSIPPLIISSSEIIMDYIPDTHNLLLEFATESGLIGLIILLIVIVMFIRQDLLLIRLYHHPEINLLIIASWLFIIGAMFNSYSKAALYTFFILRGLLQSIDRQIVPPRRKVSRNENEVK